MKKIEIFFEKYVGPISEKMLQNTIIQALTGAFMLIMPITVGVAAIAVLANLPIPVWQNLLGKIGIVAVANDFISLTLSLVAIYLVAAVAYKYVEVKKGKNPMQVAIITTACYMALIPITKTEDGLSFIPLVDLGSNGVFVAMLVGILIPVCYIKLCKMKLTIKLPNSVPENVASALSPIFVNIILFTTVFAIKYLFSLTSYGDIFTCLTEIIQKPVINIGASAGAIIFIQTLTVFLWFFGIHPATLSVVATPILFSTMGANIEAYNAGLPLPYLAAGVIYYVLVLDAVGNTLGLCINTCFAKSEKYKAMRKMIIPANIFNINEPIIFGFPVMLNPFYFVPLLLATVGNGLIAVIYMKLITIPLNPALYMAWVTPRPIFTFLAGGWQFLLLWVLCLVVDCFIWMPFFRMDDRREYEKEQKFIEENK